MDLPSTASHPFVQTDKVTEDSWGINIVWDLDGDTEDSSVFSDLASCDFATKGLDDLGAFLGDGNETDDGDDAADDDSFMSSRSGSSISMTWLILDVEDKATDEADSGDDELVSPPIGAVSVVEQHFTLSMNKSFETRRALQKAIQTKVPFVATQEDDEMDYRFRQFHSSMVRVTQSSQLVRKVSTKIRPVKGPKTMEKPEFTWIRSIPRCSCRNATCTPSSTVVVLPPSTQTTDPSNVPQRTFEDREASLHLKAETVKTTDEGLHGPADVASSRTSPTSVCQVIVSPGVSLKPISSRSSVKPSNMVTFLKDHYPKLYASSRRSQESRPNLAKITCSHFPF